MEKGVTAAAAKGHPDAVTHLARLGWSALQLAHRRVRPPKDLQAEDLQAEVVWSGLWRPAVISRSLYLVLAQDDQKGRAARLVRTMSIRDRREVLSDTVEVLSRLHPLRADKEFQAAAT